jgi:5'-3' exonuclease
MKVFLIDGTYELFRQFFGRPSHLTKDLQEVGAARGVLGSVLQLIEDGATHIGVATDHVIESFRNNLYPGYKTGEGIDPTLFSQFPVLEDALIAMGIATWPMIDQEADDGLASAAKVAAADGDVEQVVIMTPDKDLAQCVDGARVVQVDRRNNKVFDTDGVREKFGVLPKSIPDYLALVGDAADGFPGISGWGAKSTATVLAHYEHIENIPDLVEEWVVKPRGAAGLASELSANRENATLYKDLATLRTEPPVIRNVAELRWQGPTPGFAAMCSRLEQPRLFERAQGLSDRLHGGVES